MYSRTFVALAIALTMLSMAPAAEAAGGYSVNINTVDYVSDVVYHADGTVSYGAGQGFYTISNPTSASPLFSASATPYSGSAIMIGNIAPSSDYTGAYAIGRSDVRIPLLVKETIAPATLTQGKLQQVNMTVEVHNVAAHNVTGFKYSTKIPSGLSLIGDSFDHGVLDIGDNITWEIDDIPSSATYCLNVSFNVTPSSSVYFAGAYIWYTAGDSSVNGDFGFSGSTITSFSLQKSHPDANIWAISASVPDDSEFNMSLTRVCLYRSDADDPFNTVLIRDYAPDVTLVPGSSWDIAFADTFDRTPAYFMKVAYQIPYTVHGTSSPLTPARTEPFTITVQGSSAGGSIAYPYVPSGSTAVTTPTATAQPYVPSSVVFTQPEPDEVLQYNNTTLNASVIQPQASGFVAFYSSRDNETWAFIGRSAIVNGSSTYRWDVPATNGRYYLKAEYYDNDGLAGDAYQRVRVQHVSEPVDMTTLFSQSADWLVLLTILALLLIASLFILPPLVYKPVVYDTSALRVLSGAGSKELSRLPRSVRPNNVEIPAFKGSGRIRPREVKKPEEQQRLENSYGLDHYDAAALELAIERGLTMYSDDPRILELCESVGVRADYVMKLLKKVKK
jgi:hypothetical protein